MKYLDDITLTRNQSQALSELEQRLKSKFEIEQLILFGSFVRGESDTESDIDLLVITPNPLPRRVRHGITDIVFEVNLEYDTNFSTLVVDRNSWEEGPFSIMPIREEIIRDGVLL